MEQGKSIILVEDTEVVNSGYSLLLREIRDQGGFNDSVFIHWRSPGFESTEDGLPILSMKATYTNREESWLPWKDFYHNCNKEVRDRVRVDVDSLVSQILCLEGDYLDVDTIHQITYKGTKIGRGINSLLIRTEAEMSLSRMVNKSEFAAAAKRLATSLGYYNFVLDYFNVEAIVLSECVYYSAPLIEMSVSRGVKVPFFYGNDCPLVVHEEIPLRGILSGLSHRAYARYLKTQKELSQNARESELEKAKFELRDRLAGRRTTYHNPEERDQDFIDRLYADVSPSSLCIANTPKDLRAWEQEVSLSPKSLVVVFYLHAVTDGAYFLGDSGYPLISQFFEDVLRRSVESAARLGCEVSLVIKPHPNLVTIGSSEYPSIDSRNQVEIEVSRGQYVQLISLATELGIARRSICLAKTRLPLKHLFCMQNSVHVTHHGTVAHDLLVYSLPTIVSPMIPGCTLFEKDEGTYIFRRNDNQNDLLMFLENNVKGSAKKRIKYRQALHAESYLSIQYNNIGVERLFSELNQRARDEYGMSFDKTVYGKGGGWRVSDDFRNKYKSVKALASLCTEAMLELRG